MGIRTQKRTERFIVNKYDITVFRYGIEHVEIDFSPSNYPKWKPKPDSNGVPSKIHKHAFIRCLVPMNWKNCLIIGAEDVIITGIIKSCKLNGKEIYMWSLEIDNILPYHNEFLLLGAL